MDKKDLRIVFMGTPEFAVGTLQRLVERGYNVVAAVTQPDKPTGRHAEMTMPAVKRYAINNGIPVLQPEKMKDPAFLAQLADYKADLQVVVAFRMLPEAVWAMPRYGTFNVHASLLPQYRGAAPINWAIINGETETGITTFMLDKEIDTGRIIMQKRINIPDDADVETLYNRLMELGAETAIETIDLILQCDGKIVTIPQNNSVPMLPAPKIFKETCEIDWNRTAKQVYDFIRGLSPVPGAWTKLSLNGERTVKIFSAKKTDEATEERPGTVCVEKRRLLVAAKDKWLELTDLQIAGKKRTKAADIINGLRG